MSGPLIIRNVAPTDFAEWEPLWEGYNRFYGRSGPTALPDEITKTTWSRFFDADEPVYALVGTCINAWEKERDGELLGLVHYLYHRSTIMIAPICYLQDLFTTESARGEGVGRALIEAVYELAKAAGSTRVYWQTHETNLTAMRLYDKVAERSGFVVYRKQV